MTAPSEALASVAMVAPVLLGIAVLTAQAIIAGARDRLRDDAVNLALTVTGWSLIAVGILGSFLTLIAVVWIPWWIVAFVVMIETVHKYHKSQQYALLWLLAASAEKSMPLVPAIEAFARERGGHFGRRTKRVAELLKSGLSLPDALARCGDVLPPRAVSIIRMGCESGSLPSALQDAVTTVGHYRSVWTSVAGKLIYVIAMLCYGVGILSFVMCCIAPKFGKMFKEFGVVLPGPCRLLINVSNVAANYWYLSVPFWLALTGFIFHATLRHYGWIQWDLPGIGWFLRRLDAANLMDSLAIVARQERPLLDGITGLARSYPRPSIRRRLARAA
ncbi:MAG: type II secretion system F family protein, partial [Planctomycetaceae bacterium]|nr:type II secretion system F family protein [Planctomycetaceae bacterium]